MALWRLVGQMAGKAGKVGQLSWQAGGHGWTLQSVDNQQARLAVKAVMGARAVAPLLPARAQQQTLLCQETT